MGVRTRLAIGAAVAVTVVAATTVPASAGLFVTVDGEATCRPDGTYEITWTFLSETSVGEEPYTLTVDLESAVLGGEADGDVAFSPDPIVVNVPAGEPGDPEIPLVSEGTTVLPGSTSGEVTLFVEFVIVEAESGSDADGSVTLAGDCVPEVAPTTATPTSTTTAAPAAPRAARPTFTG